MRHTTESTKQAVKTLLAFALVAIASLALASPALAIWDHRVVEDEFTIKCDESPNAAIQDIAIDEDDEILYVFCERGFTETPPNVIEKYDFNGNAVNFDVTKPYVSGNEITGNPGAANGTLRTGFAGGHIAVDNSGGPHDGEIYLVTAGSGVSGGTENISIFRQSGEYAGAIEQPEFIGGNSADVDVGPDGSVYFLTTKRIAKYDAGYNEVARMYIAEPGPFTNGPGNRLVADGKGAVWNVRSDGGFNGPVKFEPDQLFTNFTSAFGSNQALFTGKPSPYVPNPLEAGMHAGVRIDVDPDPARDDLYVNKGNKVEVFSEGTPDQPAYRNAPPFGDGVAGGTAIEVTKDHRVFTSHVNSQYPTSEQKIVIFGPGEILPDVFTHAADVEEVDHTGAKLRADVDLDGGTNVVSCKLEVGPSKGQYDSVPPVACAPSAFASDSPVSAEVSGLTTGQQYHYRFSATNEKGTNYGGDRVFTPAHVLRVKTKPATGVDEDGATLQGQLDPDGVDTSYYFEYGLDANYGQTTPLVSAGSAPGLKTVSAPIGELPAGKLIHYRIVAVLDDGNPGTTDPMTIGEDETFRVAATPSVYGLQATDVTETSATLHATIDSLGYPTTYHFEYGPSSNYGNSIPVPDQALTTLDEPVDVEQTITGLTPGVTYHFRVVATSDPWGPTFSPDTTFDFAPPNCPNDHSRQETGATYLPDCRGYELVSPGSAGAVELSPGQITFDLTDGLQDPLQEDYVWPLNTGLASGPPRLMFYGFLGTVDGLKGPNLLNPDSYLATRTNTGWVTTLPGLDDSFGTPSLKECSDGMDVCLEYNSSLVGEKLESEPYVYDAEGRFRERLPQNANLVPNANKYKGFRRTSPDFTNYVFSSRDTKGIFGEPEPSAIFTVDGQVTGAGSAYDNDLENRTVTLISRLPGTLGGGHIPQNGTSIRPIQFPAISGDGSHVLMMTEAGFDESGSAAGPPYHLYMRVNDAVSYDVSKGDVLEFVGMTRSGSSVTFTSEDQLDPKGNDTDSSIDLYRWNEATGDVSLASAGNGNGNSNECSAGWTEGCDIEVPTTERRYAATTNVKGNEVPFFEAPGLDDLISENSGDVYFFSPEVLDGSKFGVPNQRNLYVAGGNGEVKLVTTFDSGTNLYRTTLGRDGRFAAFLTDSQLTSYDNAGFREVYVYDRNARTLACGSCRPGQSPENDVSVSKGGKFMSDDGRVFFDTKDSLVPRDKNGTIIDTYEYVGGRPQLISSGLASRDFTGNREIFALFEAPQYTGLEAVSRDGIDVYFSTFDTIVKEDQNGSFLKFYDARTNGGFSLPPVDAPCAAADECHGVDSAPPSPPIVTSGVPLGNSGNVRQATKHAKKRKKARKRRQGRHRRRAAHRGRSRG